MSKLSSGSQDTQGWTYPTTTAPGGGQGGGQSGYSGYSGIDGTAGGDSGSSGYSGYSGASGPSGDPGGDSGYSGASGYSGPGGSTGSTGTSGFSGRSGYSGTSGYSSAVAGSSGFSGYSGSGGGGTPGGSDTELQYNQVGVFGGIPSLTYNGTKISQKAGAFYELYDSTDSTKRVRFSIADVSTATTRTVAFPDATSYTVTNNSGVTNQFVTGIVAGTVYTAQPTFSNISGYASFAQLDRTTTVVAESATITLAANTKIKSVATGTLNTIAFSGGANVAQARRLDLDVTGGPYNITIPSCRRLGETATITTIAASNGYHEFSWEYIDGAYVMSDSVAGSSTGGSSGYSGYSGGGGGVSGSGYSGYSGSGISGYSGSGFSGFSGPSLLLFTTATGNYVLSLLNANAGLRINSGVPRNVTVPENASVAFPIGTQITIEQAGSGIVTLVPGSGVVINGANTTSEQYSVLVLIKQATDTWLSATGAAGGSGYSGYSGGASGYSGYSSTSGFSGYSSVSGFSGFSGRSGYSGPSLLTWTTQTDTNYSLQLSDANKGIRMDSTGGGYELTVPKNDDVAFPIGTQIVIEQASEYVVTIVSNTPAVINGVAETAGQYTVVVLIKQDTDQWLAGTASADIQNLTDLSAPQIIVGSNETQPAVTELTLGTALVIVGDTVGVDVDTFLNDEEYDSSWDGDIYHAPTKNAVYDKIETLGEGGGGESGYSGYSGGGVGSSGFSGYSSSSGYSGYSSASGYSGYSSQSGFSGFSSLSGFSGKSGWSGYSAFSGYSGYSAPSGYSGYSAPSGYSGYSAFSGFSGPQLLVFSTQTDTDYTLVLGDANTGVNMSSSSPHNLTIPLNASVAFPVGTQIPIEQGGTGIVTIVATGGVTVNGVTTSAGRYTVVTLIKQATDTWLAAGSPASGYSGYSSISGYSGYSGPSGYSGYSGPSGYSGFSAYSGYSGTSVLYAVAAGQALVSTSLVDITGLTFSLVTGTYIFESWLYGNCATGTAGCQLGINYSGTYTSGDYQAQGILSGTTMAQSVRGTANNTAVGTFMTTSAAEGYVGISGQIVTGGSGTFSIRALKVSSQTFTVRAGSWARVVKVA